MSSSLMLGLKAGRFSSDLMGEVPSDYLSVVRGVSAVSDSLAEAFLSWPLWYNKDGLVGMAYTTCTMEMREFRDA